jgi:alanine racemase
MPRPIIAKIYPQAVAHNIEVAQKVSGAKAWATIKANAYGHGIERIFSGLQGAQGLAMLDFDEARRVRNLGWVKPILMLEGCFCPDDYRSAQSLDLTVVVHHAAQIDWLIAANLHKNIDVYLKMNTGMNRVGFMPVDFGAAFERLNALANVGHITLMTHFANADLNDGITQAMARFHSATASIFIEQPQLARSCSNSAAVLAHPQAHFDWVRPGIMIYGSSPFSDKSAHECGLMPAMALQSEIISVQRIEAGEAVGYGSRFVADKPMVIGVVACGYADGYPRHAPDGTPVVVNGQRTRLVGRVSMDMLMVDLTDIDGADVGSSVELWGRNLSIDDVAQASGTIGYELMCALAQRVPVVVEVNQ